MFLQRRVLLLIVFFLFAYLFYKIYIYISFYQGVVVEDVEWGIDKNPLLPNSHNFIFRRVIPNRIVLHPVNLKSNVLSFTYIYPLPLNEILGLDDTFSVKIDLVYLYDLDPYKL